MGHYAIDLSPGSALFGRWLAFNAVGALGIGVQLGLLAVLVHLCGLHYLPATAVAVEAAVLHNFVWHQRWTWKDRPGAGVRTALSRLGRFHLLNGLVSLGGNLGLMAVLAGALRLDPVLANVVAIAACSLVNFAASETLVFRHSRAIPVLALLASGTAGAQPVWAQSAETLAAWREYERRVDERYEGLANANGDFLAHAEFDLPDGWRDTVSRGGVAMARLEGTGPRAAKVSVPGGRIHHWAGAVFVPGVTLDQVLARLKGNAGREADLYDDVVASKLLGRDGDRLRVFMKLRRESIITVSYNTEHAVEYRRLGPSRATSRSVAARIAELADAGTPREREKPAGEDHGFLWRLNAYWRYEQVDGGVLIECESVTLSRSVPALVGPMVNPIVDRLARESLERTLTQLKRALTS
jgi:putative flippase GtrA